jgi:hypothetical protein
MNRRAPLVAAREQARFYGAPVGILLLDCVAPYVPGSVGNASTYRRPARFRSIPGCTVERLIFAPDDALEATVVESARELVAEGAQILSSNCGFMLRYQRPVAQAVDALVALSSLLLVPFLQATLPASRSLGVITASERSLTPDVLAFAGIGSDARLAIVGLDDAPAFRAAFIDCDGELDIERVRDETEEAASRLVEDRPDVGAILLECSELPPYAPVVQRATGLPVFDFVSMIEFFAGGFDRSGFSGLY